jgi:hypothetical protein
MIVTRSIIENYTLQYLLMACIGLLKVIHVIYCPPTLSCINIYGNVGIIFINYSLCYITKEQLLRSTREVIFDAKE